MFFGAELEEEWVDELAAARNPDQLVSESEAFTEFMDDGHRDALKDPTGPTDTVRLVRAEIRRRSDERS